MFGFVISLVILWLGRSAKISMSSRSSFTKVKRSSVSEFHTVIFAVVQNNITVLDEMLSDRSSPSSPLYQQWLTYDEVTQLTDNSVGSKALKDWLSANSIKVLWTSRREHYFSAIASIGTWESLLNSQFYEWQDQSYSDSVTQFTRCDEYEIPLEIAPHVSAIFNTVQIPPVMVNSYKPAYPGGFEPTQFRMDVKNDELVQLLSVPDKKEDKKVAAETAAASSQTRSLSSQNIDVPFLRSYYDIPTTSASSSPRYNQSVIALTTSYFSPADLRLFQQTYNLTVQSAISIGGHVSSDCSNVDCSEGNLDIQYISGISQVSGLLVFVAGKLITVISGHHVYILVREHV